MTIGEAMKTARRKVGMTQEKLAKLTGYRPSQISLWETGGAFPSIMTCITLSDALGCTIDELVGRAVTE